MPHISFTGFDALLISGQTNITYLTGFAGLAPDEREAYILLFPDISYLFVSPLYIEEVKTTIKNPTIVIQAKPALKTLTHTIALLLKQHDTKTLGVEFENLTVAEWELIRSYIPARCIDMSGTIEQMRQIKSPNEIVHIKSAAKLTDDCFTYIQTKITPGISEKSLAWEIESYIKSHGAELAFSPIVAFGANTANPHHISDDKKCLENNDIILLDFAARVRGYCADMTRMLFIGKPQKIWTDAYTTLLNAQMAVLETMQKQTKINGAALDKIARDIVTQAGYPAYPHSLGHSLGLDIHEAPRLSMYMDETLLPGMVLTVEPGIYLPGQFGIRIEDLVVINKNGCEIVSMSSKDIIVI